MARKKYPTMPVMDTDYDYSKSRDGVNNGVLGDPGVSESFSNQKTNTDFTSLIQKGENHNGFKSLVPSTETNEIVGEGRKKWNNLFRWS